MLIIDTNADSLLIKALESIRQTDTTSRGRCVHFKLAGSAITASTIHPVILSATSRHLTTASPEIYFCDDGDVYVLSTMIPAKFLRLMILDIASYLDVIADESLAEIYDLESNLNLLLVMLEERLQKRQEAIAHLQKHYEEEKLRRRRQAILDDEMQPVVQNIASRRKTRITAELMIIEDDVFSRRLVENVLSKQYPLTALGSAELALATYANLAPDVLFLDIDLPDVTGHELLQKIIALDAQAYIVMLSGNSDQANIMQAMKAGAKGFIAKPFTRDKLLQYIDRCPTIKH